MALIQIEESALDSLKRMVEELEKDAARYRWLRIQHWSESEICVVASPKQAVNLGYDCPSTDRLDAAIDAAIGHDEFMKKHRELMDIAMDAAMSKE